ncbi:antibiotic biosynthesis monooxygenase [Streptomyces sp. TUS-ST3]|jgi:quinol monooxygenase YgiN|uniref:antibiotic biosynthesis monooxygenase family protein n=1 Tax=Streptomyces sp. TUS-ST3 TaxID=3025591 RepID=UPI00235B489C|nr:antibiotic biosynthesis monooxygenase family protein [Streptomyces sp. TUS-ST3]GLP63740.1 antibiotic biosynthesis monooxygenase [Streptomyces sp. TUS-ST3]
MGFRVVLRMEVEQGAAAAFEAEWLGGTDAVTGHPACLGQWLARDTAEPRVYWIVSDWVDEAGFRSFEDSPEHLRHRAKLHPFRSGGSFHTMDIVARIEGRAAVVHDG